MSSGGSTDTISKNFTISNKILFTSEIVGADGKGIPSIVTFYLGNGTTDNETTNGTLSVPLDEGMIDLEIEAFSGKSGIIFHNLDITEETNKQVGIDRHTEISGSIITQGIDNRYNISNATIRLYYDDLFVSNPTNLLLFKCDNYDFEGRSCNGAFRDITQEATNYPDEGYMEAVVTSFSGFSISQGTDSSVSQSSTSQGVSSSTSQGQSQSSPSSPHSKGSARKALQPYPGCSYRWDCDEWESNSCPSKSKQIRTCRNLGTCGGYFGMPTEIRNCPDITKSMPKPALSTGAATVEPEMQNKALGILATTALEGATNSITDPARIPIQVKSPINPFSPTIQIMLALTLGLIIAIYTLFGTADNQGKE